MHASSYDLQLPAQGVLLGRQGTELLVPELQAGLGTMARTTEISRFLIS